MSRARFSNPGVEAVFRGYPPAMRKRLMALRQLIFDTAKRTQGVGRVEEALRWGMPSYLTPETKSGSTVRIHWTEKQPEQYAMYFHCQTSLVPTFQELFPGKFTYEGMRAIVFTEDDEVPALELGHCISLALTYHLHKGDRQRHSNGAAQRGKLNVRIKRVYEPVESSDGLRVLVDRLWPRGLSKKAAKIDLWVKELAPSNELRRWFHSAEGTWPEFRKRYRKELSSARTEAAELRKTIGKRKATFLFASKTERHNHAQLLKAHLEGLGQPTRNHR